MNIKELAKLANVSISTVSRVINNNPKVNSEIRKKVQELIDKYNYVPNLNARSLSSKSNSFFSIAVIVPDINNPFYSEIIKTIFNYVDSKYHIMIFDSNDNPEEEKEILGTLKSFNILGALICLTSSKKSIENLNLFKNYFIPFVLFDRNIETEFDFGVFLDDFKGGYMAGQALIKSKHSDCAAITGPLSSYVARERLKGFMKAFTDENIVFKEENIYEGDFLYGSGYNSAIKIINFNPKITAIFPCNNLMTLGVIKALKDFKLEDKYSIIGFDNPDYFDILGLNISGIYRDIKLMGSTSIELLLEIIKNQNLKPTKILLKPFITLKGSEKKISKN